MDVSSELEHQEYKMPPLHIFDVWFHEIFSARTYNYFFSIEFLIYSVVWPVSSVARRNGPRQQTTVISFGKSIIHYFLRFESPKDSQRPGQKK